MKDLPLFTTENGAASLTLREIPYTGRAYAKLQASQSSQALIEDVAGFCRAVGAQELYAAGSSALECYPFHTAILQMRCAAESIPDTDAALWPVQESTVEEWRKLYNEKAASVPNGAWMTGSDAREMLRSGGGYFVHRAGKLLGIGRVSGDTILWVASVQPGAGADVVCALAHAVTGDSITLEVASTNQKAVRLYDRLGFLQTAELSRWYRVL